MTNSHPISFAKRIARSTIAGISLLASAANVSIFADNETELRILYEKFEAAAFSQISSNLLQLYVDPYAPLAIVNLNGPLPDSSFGPTFAWVEQVETLPSPYNLRIGDDGRYLIEDGIAVSIFPFTHTRPGVSGSGCDLFLYVKTIEGWKIAVSNNTWIRDDDTATKAIMRNGPEDAANQMLDAINSRDSNGLINAFRHPNAVFAHNKQVFDDVIIGEEDTIASFADSLVDLDEDATFELSNVEVEIADTYLATLTADYVFAHSTERTEAGRLMMTLIADTELLWEITGVVRTENESKAPSWVNVSNRGTINGELSVLTTGFVVAGDGHPNNFLIRAIGPGLNPFGVSNPVANPALTIHDSEGTEIFANDNWSESDLDLSTWEAAFSKTGAFPLEEGSLDAALLVTLPAGVYTARAYGIDGSAGNCLVSAYAVE